MTLSLRHSHEFKDYTLDKYKESMAAPEAKDPISRKIAQFYKDTLKIQ